MNTPIQRAWRGLFLDIETEGWPEKCALLPEPKAPGNLKDPEKIAAAILEKKNEQLNMAALDPDVATIRSIAYAESPFEKPTVLLASEWNVVEEIDDQEVIIQTGEATILDAFWRVFAKHRGSAIGYNILSFDLPFILRRSMELQIKPTIFPSLAKYRIDPIIDLYAVLYNWGPGKGLKFICSRYDLNEEDWTEEDGSMVSAMDDDTLKGYAERDIVRIQRLWLIMNGYFWPQVAVDHLMPKPEQLHLSHAPRQEQAPEPSYQPNVDEIPF